MKSKIIIQLIVNRLLGGLEGFSKWGVQDYFNDRPLTQYLLPTHKPHKEAVPLERWRAVLCHPLLHHVFSGAPTFNILPYVTCFGLICAAKPPSKSGKTEQMKKLVQTAYLSGSNHNH